MAKPSAIDAILEHVEDARQAINDAHTLAGNEARTLSRFYKSRGDASRYNKLAKRLSAIYSTLDTLADAIEEGEVLRDLGRPA